LKFFPFLNKKKKSSLFQNKLGINKIIKTFPRLTYFLILLLFSFVWSNHSITGDDEVIHDIKSMSWKKINRNFSQKPRVTQTEAYALVRYQEEHSRPNKEYILKLLYSILTGSIPEKIDKDEINTILSSSILFDKAIIRLSYWKFYHELSHKKLLNYAEKVQFLEKIPHEADPIFIEAFEELCKLILDAGSYQKIIQKISDLKESDKHIVYTDKVKLYHSIALHKSNESKKAISLLFQILEDENNIDLKKEAFAELKKINGSDFYLELPLNEMSYVLNVLNKDELKTLQLKNTINSSVVSQDVKVIKNISNYFLKNSPKNTLSFLRGNSQTISNEQQYLSNICENLINSKDLTLAYAIQNEFLQKSEIALVYKNYSRIYDAWDDEEKKINFRIKYLSLNPYDLTYQDMLIDYLAETNSNSVSYAPLRYWEKAMTEIPNVSVKGRLVYWYLRYLRFANEKEKLKEILADFYTYCPGSYYATVISEEFKSELSALSHPNNYLSNRESLLKFISVKHNIDFVALLGGQNLSFAFSKNAIDLAAKLSHAVEKVNSNPILSTSADYFKLGNHKEGMMLAELYFKVSKLSEKEKQELLVGIGDVSKNYYLSLYYTRILMKLYQIPDDPILIPKDLTNRLYPRPHRALVKKNADRFGIEEEVVYAIMRQESFFRENAISPANARGLMQVMPSTGKFLASRLNVTNYSLHDPEVSIQFGAKFLADLLKDNGNKLTWASIAYNGGPGNLRKWKRNHFKGDFNHFLEELPNKESRDYCRIIISNYMIYKTLKKMDN
jgi:hypothetical protein